MLKNPVYGGAYVYGRRQVEERLDAEQRPIKRVREQPDKNWHVLIEDHHEGYISWEHYERNQRQITSNRRTESNSGAAREGVSLLQGLVLCGRCGRPMKVNYSKGSQLVRYVCAGAQRQTGGSICQAFGAIRLERAFEQLLLEALAPLGVEAMLEAEAMHLKAGERHRTQGQQRLEHARYEVDLARRQYAAVDPANRRVAGELERRWEQALQELEQTKTEVDAKLKGLDKPLSTEEKVRLHQFAHDLPSLGSAPTTRNQDKKRIARCLVEQVTVKVPDEDAPLKAEVHWAGGEVTPIKVAKGRTGIHRYATDPEIVDLVRRLAEEFSDEQIARILHRKRLRTSKGLPFNAQRVTNLRYTHEILGRTRAKLNEKHVYTAEQAAKLLGVRSDTVVSWIELGLLKGSQITPGAPWWIQVTEADQRRLTAADAPKGWLPLKGAAQAMGVSQQTVLQKLKSGELEGVRVRVGARTAWRIHVDSKRYDNQMDLFD